jgi:hypothetical protein
MTEEIELVGGPFDGETRSLAPNVTSLVIVPSPFANTPPALFTNALAIGFSPKAPAHRYARGFDQTFTYEGPTHG